jgi:hypothetical protein
MRVALYVSVTILVSINLVRFLLADPIWIMFSLVGVVVGVVWILFAAFRLYVLIYEMVEDFKYG